MFYLTVSWSEGPLARRMIWKRVSGRAMSILNLFLLPSADKSALRSAGTFLPRVRAPPPASWPDGGPEKPEITLLWTGYI
ncbi:hypothetical protein PoB_005097600 [Plakobranchus ocellatus]|uniref:Uncharacterized protein n=1 Tax=Plakobranchus ocellatus TaxID=259542 RepID=A0AAV4BVC7_9GAST|nr:hypothetical protein PoB_005097600 [Plakobranchus ocellatus]